MSARVLVAGLTLLLGVAPVPATVRDVPAPAGPDSASVAHLLVGLRGSDPLVCAMATDLLGSGMHWSNGGEDIATLRDAVVAQPAVRERFRSPISDERAVRLLVPELGGPNACLRRTAAALLGESSVPAARTALREALRSGEPRTREAATYGLGVAADSADASRVRSLLGDADAGVARLAAWAVGSMEDHASAQALVGLLKHRDAGVRRAAAWALGRL